MAYADDIVPFAQPDAGLKRNFTILKAEMSKCGLQINAAKSGTKAYL